MLAQGVGVECGLSESSIVCLGMHSSSPDKPEQEFGMTL